MAETEQHNFRLGDRVRLSEIGKKHYPRTPNRCGTVVAVGGRMSSGRILTVLFDGNTTPTRLYRSYVEPIDRQRLIEERDSTD
jgi:hypothetical protein